MIFIGIDCGRTKHNYVVVNDERKRLESGVVPNESWAFEAWCEHIEQKYPGEELVVGIEQGGGISSPFDSALVAYGWTVRVLSPKAVRTYREDVLRIHNKTDDTDGYTIAIMLASHSEIYRPFRQDRAALRRATRWRDKLVTDKTALINELRATMALYWPETATSNVFCDLAEKCEWAWLVLEHYPDPVSIVKLGSKRLLRFFRKNGSTVPQQKVDSLVELARKNKDFAQDKPFLLEQTAQLAKLVRQVSICKLATEASITRMCADDVDVQAIDAVFGVSAVQAAGFMAEVRAFELFDTNNRMASYSGAAQRQLQSGKFLDKLRPQRRCNRRLKRCLFGIASTLKMNDPRSKAYYDKKIKEGKHHKQALAALARHVLRRFYRLLKKNHAKRLAEACPQVDEAAA